MFCAEYSRVSFLLVLNANLLPLAYFHFESLVSSLILDLQIFELFYTQNYNSVLNKLSLKYGMCDFATVSCGGP